MLNVLSPSEWKKYNDYKRRIEEEEAERKAKEAEAAERVSEKRRAVKEMRDEWLQKNNPQEWEREVARRAAKRREAEENAKKAARNAAWVKGFETESLEDIADEIIKAYEDPAFLPSLLLGSSENIHRLWVNRIMKARKRSLT